MNKALPTQNPVLYSHRYVKTLVSLGGVVYCGASVSDIQDEDKTNITVTLHTCIYVCMQLQSTISLNIQSFIQVYLLHGIFVSARILQGKVI